MALPTPPLVLDWRLARFGKELFISIYVSFRTGPNALNKLHVLPALHPVISYKMLLANGILHLPTYTAMHGNPTYTSIIWEG